MTRAGSSNGNAFLNAVSWIEHVLLGTLGTTLSIIAVTTLGLMMLSGRVPARRGAIAILGCFILFGAGTIARGLMRSQTF